jgi:hypothetical protein
LSGLSRRLRRLARLILEALPIQSACRALGRGRARGVAVVLCFDVEPDGRALDRGDPGPWPSFEEIFRRAAPLRERLAALSGEPVAFSWFVRMDPQVAEVWGSPSWGAQHYRAELAALEREGDDVGLHTHVWRWDPDAESWLIDFSEEWGEHCLGVGLDAFEAAMGRPSAVHRTGDRGLNGAMLELLANRGVEVDLTIEPDLDQNAILLEGERSTGPLPSYQGLPRAPYRSTRSAFPRPDPESRAGPLLVPLTGVARKGYWERALLLASHPSVFAVRLLVELVRRRPTVLAHVQRTDPEHIASWAPVVENLEHLARHGGVRFVAASAVARGTRPAESPAGRGSARSSEARTHPAGAR